MKPHLATTVQILETGEYVAECHTCDWCSPAYGNRAPAECHARRHEQATRFGRTA